LIEIRYEREDNVGVLTLAAPERRNALRPQMVTELLRICDEIDADSTVGAVVLRALGDSFCAGADRALLAGASRDPAHPDHYRDLGLAYQAFVRVGQLKPPTIAAIRGHAVGAGVNLMLATDLRIVAEEARIISGFSRIGIHPGGGHFTLLGRLAGREVAAALGIFGLEISGRQAVEFGLAWEAVPEPQVEPRALELARRVAGDPELARATAQSLRLELGPPPVSWQVGLEVERAVQMWSLRRKAQE
jgi:enoyl-CoA hydratase